jgi:hypothetical protein
MSFIEVVFVWAEESSRTAPHMGSRVATTEQGTTITNTVATAASIQTRRIFIIAVSLLLSPFVFRNNGEYQVARAHRGVDSKLLVGACMAFLSTLLGRKTR